MMNGLPFRTSRIFASCQRIDIGNYLRAILLVSFVFVLSGCGAKAYKVESDLIKGFQDPVVPADKTGIYVIRGENYFGAARGLWVAINDGVVADLSNGSHVYLEVDSGLNSLHFIQAKAGFGYLAVDNKPGKVLYTKVGYGTTGMAEFLAEDLGKSMVVTTRKVDPFKEKRDNDAYDNLIVNPGVLDFPIMVPSTEEMRADAESVIVRFYRPGKLIPGIAFDVWNQDGYVGSTKGGAYFSVRLKPGRHTFIALSERYSVLDANLAAGKEYAVELAVGMGWTQAHIKLLPVDLSMDSGKHQIEGWKKNLKAMVVDPNIVATEALAKRLATGMGFLENQRKAVASSEEPKRDLPVTFGK